MALTDLYVHLPTPFLSLFHLVDVNPACGGIISLMDDTHNRGGEIHRP